MASDPGRHRRGSSAVVTGLAVASACGRGPDALFDSVCAGTPAFGPVTRFDTAARRVRVAATLHDAAPLPEELAEALHQSCTQAGLTVDQRKDSPLLLAWHPGPDAVRAARRASEAVKEAASVTAAVTEAAVAAVAVHAPKLSAATHAPGSPDAHSAAAMAAGLAARCGLGGAVRTYTTACVSASTAVADAAAMIATGRADRVVVAAGYLVDQDYFGLFDAGRALATDGRIRPFSRGRTGLLLGDAVAAVVLESPGAARARGAEVLGRVLGWGRAGDAHHVCRPHPEGAGVARAVRAALDRAGVSAEELDYVNAHGTGTPFNDSAEAAGLRRALGPAVDRTPVSSTKSVHGHTLEASGLLELAVVLQALRHGRLPVNAGFLDADPECRLDLVLGEPRESRARYALSLNAAFGGANTALLIGAP
ncbi:beta-ketoacyl synthase [Streptacidiphilus sp. EB129]|uniref:beta-ketoacyl-[acyl-carrier-protein] synthase family protein n=1 Tax=Streptacidiphilus sp. EB129 TaxID=3156262 RepID=UPI00351764A5